MRQRKESLFSMVIKLYFNLKVWAGPLSLGRTVVLLWNRSDMSGNITAKWGDIGLQAGTAVTIYDIWKV
jgi:alpha-galactosidase